MMDSTATENVRTLDPFGFVVGYRSAIKPLGGDVQGPDPRYVFHTPYIQYEPGRVLFTVTFDRLQASRGELHINVYAFVPGSGRDALLVTSSRLHMADRGATSRPVRLSIMTVPGASYALHGYCSDGTDAVAAGLSVSAEEIPASAEAAPGEGLLPTRLTADAIDPTWRLVENDPPSLANPVSQAMSDAQLAEPEYRHWTARFQPAVDDPDLAWQLAFVAQALNRYGMLREGARGIAVGERSHALAPVMAGAGCRAVLASVPASDEAAIDWNSVLCKSLTTLENPVPVTALLAEQPTDERGFDFMWSFDMAERGYVAGNTAGYLIDFMRVLRPRGYAVHMLLLRQRNPSEPPGLPRIEVERLAVSLLSRGFSIVQLNFGAASDRDLIPFGLIVRKD